MHFLRRTVELTIPQQVVSPQSLPPFRQPGIILNRRASQIHRTPEPCLKKSNSSGTRIPARDSRRCTKTEENSKFVLNQFLTILKAVAYKLFDRLRLWICMQAAQAHDGTLLVCARLWPQTSSATILTIRRGAWILYSTESVGGRLCEIIDATKAPHTAPMIPPTMSDLAVSPNP